MSRDLVNLRCKTPVQRRSKSASTESASHLPTTADAAGRTSSDPLPPQSQSAKRLVDAARRIELLVGYTRKEAAPFAAMNPRIARAKRLGPPGGILERAAAAAMTRLVLSAPARRLAKTWQRYCGRSATFRVDWSPSRLGACHCIELPLLFDRERRGRMRRCSAAAHRQSTRRGRAPQLKRLRAKRCGRTRLVQAALQLAPGVISPLAANPLLLLQVRAPTEQGRGRSARSENAA